MQSTNSKVKPEVNTVNTNRENANADIIIIAQWKQQSKSSIFKTTDKEQKIMLPYIQDRDDDDDAEGISNDLNV